VSSPDRTIALLIATRRRPESLSKLLDALARDYGDRADVGLVVVDNDSAGSAAATVETYRQHFTGRVSYTLEPREGYATVRNAAVLAAGATDDLVFIDDDELPESGWLDALLDAKDRYDADVVAGPAIPVFPHDAPRWLIDSGVFTREISKLPSGTTMRYCATRNTLMTRATFDLVPGGFDQRFDRSGGEDSDFFFRAARAGARIVWTNEAVVREPIERERLTLAWVLRRATRVGRTRATIDVELAGGPGAVASRAVKSCGLVVLGLGDVFGAIFTRKRARLARGTYKLALAQGMVATLLRTLLARA
jgi:succinoglycan biosynthesis protein ExoM